MAQQIVADDGGDDERKELPSYRVISGDGNGHTVMLTGGDLHYLQELSIAEIDEYGSTRQTLHGSLSGMEEILLDVFEITVAEYKHRREADIRQAKPQRIRLTDEQVTAVLYAIRTREGKWNDLVSDGMAKLGVRLSRQTNYEEPV